MHPTPPQKKFCKSRNKNKHFSEPNSHFQVFIKFQGRSTQITLKQPVFYPCFRVTSHLDCQAPLRLERISGASCRDKFRLKRFQPQTSRRRLISRGKSLNRFHTFASSFIPRKEMKIIHDLSYSLMVWYAIKLWFERRFLGVYDRLSSGKTHKSSTYWKNASMNWNIFWMSLKIWWGGS